ncbi:MAG: arylsulfatase [Phycisphaerales bacterium]|nr:arylsulfatase [Phycisphaerales bacterium]
MMRILFFLACAVTFFSFTTCANAAATPNIVLIFCDDLGYGDVGPYGSKNATPNIDRMAREGVRFTDFYVAQAVCSASRAALMTGSYSNRVSIQGALPPRANVGINSREMLMPEVFKGKGYATAIYGKWHLGDSPQFLPTRNGFDEYFGLPYSNDMWPRHPEAKFPPLPLIDGERAIETNPDQRKLTTAYTERAVSFIERNKDRPFFLYLPHTMPHVPLHVSEKFDGKTGRGMYADVIAEIDWSVGQILDALKRNGLDEKTLVVFTSDNGPWLSYGDHAGSAGPLREGKGSTFEGGVRVPCIMRWPGRITPGSVTREMAATIDLLPTFAKLIGGELPADRIIDGKDIAPLMFNEPGAKSPHETFYYYWGKQLHAVRAGKWKLIFPHEFNSKPPSPVGGGKPTKYVKTNIELSLYDLDADAGEATNVIADHADVVVRLQAIAETARDDLGDTLTNREGKNVREPGRLPASASAATAPAVSPSAK